MFTDKNSLFENRKRENSLQVSRPRNNEEEDEYTGGNIRMFNKPRVVNEVDAYMDEEIRDLPYYRNLIHYMNQMEQDDELRIWISSPGGYLDSAMDIIDAMLNAEGSIICIVRGNAASAASMIALSAPNLIVGERARMMFHNASYGMSGKHSEVEAMVNSTRNRLRKIIQDCYSGFFTEEELQKLYDGKDYYMEYDEIIERLEKRAKWQENRQLEAQKAAEMAAEAPKTRTRRQKQQ